MENTIQTKVDLELAHQRLKELDARLEHLDMKLEQTIIAKNMLTALQKTSANDEILLPIGGGVFVTVRTQTIKTVQQAVGAGVLVTKTPEESLTLLETQQKNLLAKQQELAHAYESTLHKAMQLESSIQEPPTTT